jgi:hypothetical protein
MRTRNVNLQVMVDDDTRDAIALLAAVDRMTVSTWILNQLQPVIEKRLVTAVNEYAEMTNGQRNHT